MRTGQGKQVHDVRSRNWKNGAIPVVLTLSTTSLCSPNIPAPMHTLLHRQTFLHIGLSRAVLRLSSSAIVANTNDGFWFEDEKTKKPLRWQLFAGVLFDLLHGSSSKENMKKDNFSDNSERFPWRIRLHFTSYPKGKLISCKDDTAVRQSFANSLKQSLYLQYDSSKIAMQISKNSHDKLWLGISKSHFMDFSDISNDIRAESSRIHNIPIRIYVDNKAVLQKPCKFDPDKDSGGCTSPKLQSVLEEVLPNLFPGSPTSSVGLTENDLEVLVQGFVVPREVPVYDLWLSLASPDLFLYVIVRT